MAKTSPPVRRVVVRTAIMALLAILVASATLYFLGANPQCRFEAQTEGNVSLADKRTSFFFRGSGDQNALALSSMIHATGKHYFEMTYICKGCEQSPPAIIDTGLFLAGSDRRRGLHRAGDAGDHFLGIQHLKGRYVPLRHGDVVGVAADLDKGRLYFRHNGVWLVCSDPRPLHRGKKVSGSPADADGGLAVKTRRAYAAAGLIHPQKIHLRTYGWKANFGQRPFAHPLPGGFYSWDQTQHLSEEDGFNDTRPARSKAWMAATPCCVEISGDGVRIRHNEDKIRRYHAKGVGYLPGRAVASRFRQKGKWYYEITYLDGDPTAPKPIETTVGLQSRLAQYGELHRSAPGYAGWKKDFLKGMIALKDGDVVNVALDLDRGRYHVGINGRWSRGRPPASASGGTRLPPSETYLPVAAVAHPGQEGASDGWQANFGSTSFEHSPPPGYQPYNFDGEP